jgi:hypothetical protein
VIAPSPAPLAVHLVTLSLAILGLATLDVFYCGRSILFSQDLNRIDRIDDDFSAVPRNPHFKQ